MKKKGFVLILLAVLFLPLFVFKFHEPNSGSEFQISAPLKNNHSQASHFRGRIETLAIGEIDKSTGKLKCRFVHYLNAEDGKLYQIEDTKRALKKIKPTEKVSISGNWTDGKLVISSVRILSSEQKGTETKPDTIGEQRTLVALFNYPDALTHPFTVEDVKDEVINNPDSTDNTFRKNSYGKAWLNADFIDWKTLPHEIMYYDGTNILYDSIATLDPMVYFPDYKRLIFIYNTNPGRSLGGVDPYGGRGTMGTIEIASSDGIFNASVAWIWNTQYMNSGIISHELGHNFGFSHASSVASAGPYFIPESLHDMLSSSSATFNEGDDRDDNIMGGNLSNVRDDHYFSTLWKSQTQWIDATQLQEVDASGEYIIDQSVISSTGIKALKIPMGKDTNGEDFHYWIEYEKTRIQPTTADIVQLRTKSTATYFGYWTNNAMDSLYVGDNSIRFKKQLNIVNYTPKQVSVLNDITAISGGGKHSLVLKSDGTVWAWGDNYNSQLGDGTEEDKRTPVQVKDLSNVTAISAGYSHSLALKSDGTVWAWGYNMFGQLGSNAGALSSTPKQVRGLSGVIAISAGGGFSSFALKSDGTVWAWGDNEYGQLGDGTYKNRSIPVQVGGLNNIIAISGGSFHSLALKSDGTVWAWGYNEYGQLGEGTTRINRSTPVQVVGLIDITAISSGSVHSLALKSDGTVWAWGRNYTGQLGDGSYTQKTTPVRVNNLGNIIAIAGGGNHSLALKSDGTVWAWGANYSGELGDGGTTNRSTPVQVRNLSGIITISGGDSHSLALGSDNTVWEWGVYELGFTSSQQFTDIDINKLFRDPYRGIRIKLIEKSGDGAESKAKLGVALSGLNTDPQSILDFGDVFVNSKSSKTVTVTNNSGSDIEFGSVSLGGRNPEFFDIVNDECSNKTLSNGESSNITISFTPGSEGDKFATLFIPNNDSIRHEATISLYGYGSTEITSTPTPMVTPTPTPTQNPTVVPTPVSCDDSYEPNDSNEKAYGYLTSGSSYEGKICSNSDVDWYKVNITSAGTISLSLTNPSSNDFDLELYDSSDTLIASSNSGAGADEPIHYDVTTTGDYYIKVYEFYGSYNSKSPYTLAYSFVNTVSSPTPVTTPTPTPPECIVKSIGVIPNKLKIKKETSKDITVMVIGTNGCLVEGTTVTATIMMGKNRISISPISQATDEDGKTTFKVTAGNTAGTARIMFVAGDKEKILTVKIK